MRIFLAAAILSLAFITFEYGVYSGRSHGCTRVEAVGTLGVAAKDWYKKHKSEAEQ